MAFIQLHPLLDLVQCIYIEGRWTPQSIEHKCLACCYTHCQIQYYAYIQKADGPLSQLSIDALHTTTPTAGSRPPVYQASMPCILLHPLLDIVQCIYIEGRWTPQSTEHRCLAYHYTHCQIQYYAYIQMAYGPPVNQEQMPCILLQPLLDLDPQSIELRWPSYSYTHCQIQYNAYIQKADGPPSQLSTNALHAATPTARSGTMHIYRWHMDPESIKNRGLAYCYSHCQIQTPTCRHVTLQIDRFGKMGPVLRVSTHIYGVSKKIDGKTFIF